MPVALFQTGIKKKGDVMKRLFMVSKNSMWLILLIILGMGCSHRQYISRNLPADQYGKLNSRLENKSAKVVYGPQEKNVTNVQLDPDSATFLEEKAEQESRIPLSDLQKISVKNYGRGFGDGFLIGLASGVAIFGGAVAIGSGSDDDWEALEWGVGGILAGGGVLLLSTIIGGAVGSSDIYILKNGTENHLNLKDQDKAIKYSGDDKNLRYLNLQ